MNYIKKIQKPLAVILCIIVFAVFVYLIKASASETSSAIESQQPHIILKTDNGDVTVFIEVADSDSKRMKGLMYRESMPQNNGMLFVFDNEDTRYFWMKNTKIPLDMIFINSNLTIMDIKHNVQPCTTDPCPSYASKAHAMFVLEVNGGFSEKNGIKENQKIAISLETF